MSRSITITNTSNRDGEDYEFHSETREAFTLKPGESKVFNPRDGEAIQIEEVDSLDHPAPFDVEGLGQVWPTTETRWVRSGQKAEDGIAHAEFRPRLPANRRRRGK